MREINPELKRARFGSYENDLILNRSAQTKDMVKVWQVKWQYNKDADLWKQKKELDRCFITKTRLIEQLHTYPIKVDKTVVVPINTGESIEVTAEYRFFSLGDRPEIIIVDLLEDKHSKGKNYTECVEMCRKWLREGLDWKEYKKDSEGRYIPDENGEKILLWEQRYVYCLSSTAQMRVLKGVFVQEDYKYDESYLAKFPDETYRETLRALRGPECIYNSVSYGGYLRYLKGKPYNISKFISRMGLCQSSSKDLGTISCRRIGTVKVHLTDSIIEMLVDGMEKMGLHPAEISRNIDDLKASWKEEKMDGLSLVSAPKMSQMLSKIGIKKTPAELVGKVAQFRYASAKGLVLITDKALLDAVVDGNGIPVYRGFDLIIEENSWKMDYDPDHFNGTLAPRFELVSLSRSKYTHSSNYQWLNALDGNCYGYPIRTPEEMDTLFIGGSVHASDDHLYQSASEQDSLRDALLNPTLANYPVLRAGCSEYISNVSDDLATVNAFTALIDSTVLQYEEAMTDPLKAMSLLGIKDSSVTDRIIIDDSVQNMNTIISKALHAEPDLIFDAPTRMKFMSKMKPQNDKLTAGRIPLEGANRYIISDPTPFFRMDLAEKNGRKDHNGLDMYDIHITEPEHCAIQDPFGCYWNEMSQPAVLFRAPCVHPGEPQLVNLLDPEHIAEYSGNVPTRALLAQTEDVVVINCFNSILSAMGGADIDGDTVLVCTQPEIVQLRNPHRKTLLVSIESQGDVPKEINEKNVREHMLNSLVSSGIGMITHSATTWRDIQHMVKTFPRQQLPGKVIEMLYESVKSAAALQQQPTHPDDIAFLTMIKDLEPLGTTGMDIPEMNYIVLYIAELALRVLRRLQEQAIDTAKSGIPVDMEYYCFLVPKYKYMHKGKEKTESVYPSWLVSFCNYDSYSPMAYVNEHSITVWRDTITRSIKSAIPIKLPIDISEHVGKDGLYERILQLKQAMGVELRRMNNELNQLFLFKKEKLRRTIENLKYVSSYYNKILHNIADEIGGDISVITALVYRATLDGFNINSSTSFLWSAWGNEWVNTLYHLNSGKDRVKLIHVHVLPEIRRDNCFEEGEVGVFDGSILSEVSAEYPDGTVVVTEDCEVARVAVPDGNYQLKYYDGLPYILYPYKQKAKNLQLAYEGMKLTIIGFAQMGISRDDIKDRIRTYGEIEVRGILIEGNPNPYAGVYINGERYGTFPQNTLGDVQYFNINEHMFGKTFSVKLPINDNMDKSKVNGKMLSHLTVEVIEEVSVR